MTIVTSTTVRPNVLHVLMGGSFSLEEAKQSFLQIIAALEANLIDQILIDGRDVTGDPAVVVRFYYGEFAADAVRHFTQRKMPNKDPRFAYVLHEPVLDPLRLGETVAVNRGMNVKAFDNMDEAIEWLGLT